MKIFGFISEVWGLIVKIVLVIATIVVIVGFVKSCAANATLNEHSSCQQFEQADTDTQNTVLQNMINAHGSRSSVSTVRVSVMLYCNFHSNDSPVDGIYNDSYTGLQSAPDFSPSASSPG